MNNLVDFGKSLIIVTAIPAVVDAQPIRDAREIVAESARIVYTHVKEHGTPRNYQLDDQRVIPARYWKSPEDKGGFFAFELGGIPYLVLTEPRDYGFQDFIDRAPMAGNKVDGVIDDVLVQRGTAPKHPINLNEMVANGVLQRDIHNRYFKGLVTSARYRIEKAPAIPELPTTPRPWKKPPVRNKNQI